AFNNWVKTNMITTYCKPGVNVLDIGCGRGGDIHKFINAKVGSYVGVDIDYNGLFRIKDSAVNRYKIFQSNNKNVPPMTFILANAKGVFKPDVQANIIADMSDHNKHMIKTYLDSGE